MTIETVEYLGIKLESERPRPPCQLVPLIDALSDPAQRVIAKVSWSGDHIHISTLTARGLRDLAHEVSVAALSQWGRHPNLIVGKGIDVIRVGAATRGDTRPAGGAAASF